MGREGEGPVTLSFEVFTMKTTRATEPCAEGVACVKFTAAATNPSSKPLYNADVYGRVYDRAGSAVTDVAENNRIAYVDNVPAGASEVSFVLTVPKAQLDLGGLSWRGLKASGFTGKILPGQTGAEGLLGESECDLAPDPGECEEERAAMASIR